MSGKRKRKRKPKGWMPHRKLMWIKQRYRCSICGRQIRQRQLFTKAVNIDHTIPKAHGGPSTPENLRLAHYACNQAKADNCPGCERCLNGSSEA